MSSLSSPERIWWKRLGKEERLWVGTALVWSLFMFAMMIIWGASGNQNVPVETYRITPEQWNQASAEFVQKYRVGTDSGIAVVRPPSGADVYLTARMWQWAPVLELKKGHTYRIHVSSLDLQHGFSLQPENLNLQIIPGYDYVITLTPDKVGEYQIVCNEYCGIGHNLMTGKIIVTE